MSYTSMAKDVVQFLDQQGLDQVVLVGHSMGGKVAQTIALLYPNRVQGLCVLDMAPVAYQATEPHWKAVSDIITTLQSILSSEMEKYTKQQVDKLLQSSIPDPALRGFCLTNYDNRQQEWAIPVHYIADNLNTLAGFDIITHTTTTDHHDNTNHPADSTIVNGDAPSSTVASSAVALQYQGDVFFILGGQSKFVRHAHIDTIATYFPNHMLTTIRGSGHWVHAEAPDDTIALLKRYLDR